MTDDPRFVIEDVLSVSTLRSWRWKLDPPQLCLDSDVRACLIKDVCSDSSDGHAMYDLIEPTTPPPPWLIGFSKQFKKDTLELDRKLMGRILEVLEELSDYTPPFHTHGDTFKPLKSELEGCWRYRIGDARLVLKPEVGLAQLNAIAFKARGSVYD